MSQHSTSGPAKREAWFPIICTVIVLASTAVQFASLFGGFVVDDHSLVSDAAARGCGDNPADCFKHTLFHMYYRPMVAASFAFVQRYHLHSDSPEWYHLENLAFHAITVALGLWLFRILLRRRISALIAGALFALHPAQVSVTTFIGGRSATLSILFVLLFAIGLNRGTRLLRVHSRSHSSRQLLGACLWIALSLVGLLAAAFTKEQALVLVLLTPLIACGGRGDGETGRTSKSGVRTSSRWWLGLYTIPMALYVYACHQVLRGAHLPSPNWTFRLHFEMVGRTIWYFVLTLLFPTVATLHQTTLGPWDIPQPDVVILGYGCAAVWMVLLASTWRNRSRRTMALWFTLTALPCLNLVPIPLLYVAPFRVPLPLFGLCGLCGSLLGESPQIARFGRRVIQERSIAIVILPALIYYSVISIMDVRNWRDDYALMKAEVSADPNYLAARSSLASLLAHPLDGSEPDNDAALADLNICVDQLFGKSTPEEAYARLANSPAVTRMFQSTSYATDQSDAYIARLFGDRGRILWQLGRRDAALRDFNILTQLTPRGPVLAVTISGAYREQGDYLMIEFNYQAAAENYRTALQLAPNDSAIRAALVRAYRTAGLNSRAIAADSWKAEAGGIVP